MHLQKKQVASRQIFACAGFLTMIIFSHVRNFRHGVRDDNSFAHAKKQTKTPEKDGRQQALRTCGGDQDGAVAPSERARVAVRGEATDESSRLAVASSRCRG